MPVFESAARLMSFTRAGEELHMTQPAVSRRISTLERLLGFPVFQRNHNKLELTKQGVTLLAAVELGLGHLNKVVAQIAEQREQSRLTIACGFSFASMWFQPRFTRFRQMLDGLEIHLIASEFPNDLDPEMIDIRILWQDKTWPNRDVRELYSEDTFPICSPAFADRHGLVFDDKNVLINLVDLPLLHYNPGGSGYLDWTEWFRLHRVDYFRSDSVYVFDNYQFTIQAALEGEGIALGYSVLLKNLLARGSLVQVGPSIHHRNSVMSIEFEPNRLPKITRDKIHQWLYEEARL